MFIVLKVSLLLTNVVLLPRENSGWQEPSHPDDDDDNDNHEEEQGSNLSIQRAHSSAAGSSVGVISFAEQALGLIA